MAPDLSAGQLLGERFHLERQLGEGGTGVVWAALDLSRGERVALKLLRRGIEEPRRRRRLAREARLGATLVHPHVRRVREAVELDGGLPVLVMDFLIGESLADRLKERPRLPAREAATVMLPVISAVGAAHARGIVHRDLKPGNIFLATDPPGVFVLDFGLAKRTDRAQSGDSASVTREGAMLGTPAYMSPEQVFADASIDHLTDVWSLGIVLHEALSGVLPTRAASLGQVLKRIVMEPIPHLASSCRELPADLCAVVDRMLSQCRAGRPQSLHEVAGVLARHAGMTAPAFGSPVRADPEPPSDRAPYLVDETPL